MNTASNLHDPKLSHIEDYRKPANVITSDTGTFTLNADGVYYAGFTKDGQAAQEKRISAPLHALAFTADEQGRNHGVLLKWRDRRGNHHKWAMPMTLLSGDSVEIVKELLGRGLYVRHGCKNRIVEYIQCATPAKDLTSVDRIGWHGQGTYVTPENAYGIGADKYIYQTEGAIQDGAGEAGTLEEWRDTVAAYAYGNSRLIFALSSAFAGTLIHPAGIESGGFHIHGGSSTGKSTAQLLASSVWGNPDKFKRSWRTTSNGLEGLASLHSDSILILDEIKEASAKEVSAITYMLGNGKGKTRANKSGDSRDAKTWRLMFLSTGELTLADYLQSEKERAYAGLDVRLANIQADAGAGMGMFEETHGMEGGEFAEYLKASAQKAHGVAGSVWLEAVTSDHAAIVEALPGQIKQFKAEILPEHADGQAGRVANRFALVAIAGELATQYGLTGWNAGDATQAAKRCFSDWLADFGTGKREDKQILETVRGFIDRNAAKFQSINDSIDPLAQFDLPDRVGFKRKAMDGGFEYLVFASQFDRVAEGFSKKQSVSTLKAAGWMAENGDSYRARILGLSLARYYIITPKGD